MRQARLTEALQRLHRSNGEPSTREISRRTHGALSHTTVSQTLRGIQLPSWRSLELVVSALQGDCDEFKSLWIAAREEEASRHPFPRGLTAANRKFVNSDGELLPVVAAAVNHSRLLRRDHGKDVAVEFLKEWQGGNTISSAVLVELVSLLSYSGVVNSGRYDQLLEAAVDDDYPNTSDSALWLSYYCKQKGDQERSLFFLMAALRLAPNSVRVLNRIGDHYGELFELEKAAVFYRRAHEIQPSASNVHSIVEVFCMLGRPQEAARMCQDIYASVKNSDVIDSWAKALVVDGSHAEAARILRNHADEFSEEREYSLMELGQVLCKAHHFDEAEEVFRDLLRMEPGRLAKETALAGLSYIALTRGDEAAGRASLASLLEKEGDE